MEDKGRMCKVVPWSGGVLSCGGRGGVGLCVVLSAASCTGCPALSSVLAFPSGVYKGRPKGKVVSGSYPVFDAVVPALLSLCSWVVHRRVVLRAGCADRAPCSTDLVTLMTSKHGTSKAA